MPATYTRQLYAGEQTYTYSRTLPPYVRRKIKGCFNYVSATRRVRVQDTDLCLLCHEPLLYYLLAIYLLPHRDLHHIDHRTPHNNTVPVTTSYPFVTDRTPNTSPTESLTRCGAPHLQVGRGCSATGTAAGLGMSRLRQPSKAGSRHKTTTKRAA
jgi:hypothetical protein